jgi:predicted Zn-dependent peptidase
MFARERFLNPNNATLVVAGNVQSDRVMRTLRQLLGGWRKSDTIVPPTFRQPSAPDERIFVIEPANGENVEVRYGVRGVSKGTREELSAQILAAILQNRLKSGDAAANFVVKSEANLLPGAVVISASVPYSGLKSALSSIRSEVAALTKTAPSAAEVSGAKAAVRAAIEGQPSSIDHVTERWLDSITYKAPELKERLAQLDQLSPSEIQALASRLFSSTPALVAVGDGDAITRELGPAEKIQRNVAAKSAPSTVNPK